MIILSSIVETDQLPYYIAPVLVLQVIQAVVCDTPGLSLGGYGTVLDWLAGSGVWCFLQNLALSGG